MGITRIGNITGLDDVGIPVVMVCRPNSRSLAVAQGKGLTLPAAKAAGVMEAIERYHGEHVTLPLKLTTYEELRYTHEVLDPVVLSPTSLYHPHAQLAWIEGQDLCSDERCWIPYELVHTNFTLPMPASGGLFRQGSSGLAAGNDASEAISHGICEVVERHSTARWRELDAAARSRTRIDLDTVDDPGCRQLLGKYERARIGAAVWETTTEIGIPAFLCTIVGGAAAVPRRLYGCSGMGCHPSREIALTRALTEAAQSRLTLIAGSRDDVPRDAYEQAMHPSVLEGFGPMRSFREVATHEGATFEDDLAWETARLAEAGFSRVVVVDLTRPELRIPVFRVIVPGLVTPDDMGYVLGPAARIGDLR